MNADNFNESSVEADNPKLQSSDISSELTFQQCVRLVNEAIPLISQGNYEYALGLLDEAIHCHARIQNLQYMRAVCLWNLKRFEEAKTAAISELKAFPDNKEVRNTLSQMIPQLEYIPEGWAAKDQFRGWDTERTAETIKAGYLSAQSSLHSIYAGGPFSKDYASTANHKYVTPLVSII